MKITVGMGSIDEYVDFVKAGADEVFCGYVPASWSEEYGLFLPLNRREVLYYNVQLGSDTELQILRDMVSFYGVPVSITLNSLYYIPEQYDKVIAIMERCAEYGFTSFIIADPGLLFHLKKNELTSRFQIHVSGEISEMNRYFIREIREAGTSRLIFHRKMSVEQMKKMIDDQENVLLNSYVHSDYEYEAFLLNEMCHFHGGFCNTFHCDELCHMCQMPYRLTELHSNIPPYFNEGEHRCIDSEMKSGNARTRNINFEKEHKPDLITKDASASESETEPDPEIDNIIGQSGCGLCALWDMNQIGITHLKIVSRGNYVDDTIRDIKKVKQALHLLGQSNSKDEYIRKMKAELFPDGTCSGNCYYQV